MCIIVAKPMGVKMPSKNIIETCFENNPDGAGIMLAYKGQVYGFKGLMTLEAFNDKLHQLEKRFGSLNKLSVVMHFRITTHGGTVPENTHPFPLKDNYPALRDLEWVAEQGMAHNGIISCTSYHSDINLEKVSDTMVFIKRVVAPIAKHVVIASNKGIAKALQVAANSKLAFLNGQGRCIVAGDFTQDEGIYYSNTSYKEVRVKYNLTSFKPYQSDWYDYDLDSVKYDTSTGKYTYADDWNEEDFKQELADSMDLLVLDESYYILEDGMKRAYQAGEEYALGLNDGYLYYYSYRNEAWYMYLRHDQFRLYDSEGNEVWPNA